MSLFITHVETCRGGNFLKIYGQMDTEEAIKIETAIKTIVARSQTRQTPFRPSDVQVGVRCLTVYTDGAHYRAKIVKVAERDLVSVLFIDYGNTATVHISELLSLHTKSEETAYLLGTAPQAHEYILARICGPWSQKQLEDIKEEIRNDTHSYHLEDKVDRIPIIGVLYRNFDYSQYLIEKCQIGTFISVKNQKESLLAGRLITSPPQTPQKTIPEKIENLVNMRYLQSSGVVKKNLELQSSTNPFLSQNTQSTLQQKMAPQKGKATEESAGGSEKSLRQLILPVNSFHEVTCSHVEDGYRLFSLQLKTKESELRKLMNDLSHTPLQQLSQPKLGMSCIVRHEKSGRLYRGVITNIMPASCIVYFVDFGNTENVACGNMFEMPAHFLRYKMFAVKSTLANCEELGDRHALKDFFQQLIYKKDLSMKVLLSQGSSFVLCCELFINRTSVMDELKRIQMFGLQYQPTVRLSPDFHGPVIVRYVDSPKKFYVQLVSNTSDHDVLMDKLSIYCQKQGKPMSEVKPGALCSVSVDNDVDWYRGRVVDVKRAERKVSVRLVDYGKIIDVPSSALREIGYQFTQMPPQVYECCIKGFESIFDISENSANAFEMLVEDAEGERKTLNMHIVDYLTEETLLVNLFDETQMPPVNISKSLCRSQMPYKDFVNMFEKKAPNVRKREAFKRNEIVGEMTTEQGNFTTSSDVDTYPTRPVEERSERIEKNSWNNGNSPSERSSFDGENGKMRQGFRNQGDKRNNNNNSVNLMEKPRRVNAGLPAFADNTKGFERRDNAPRDGKAYDRGSDRNNDRGIERNIDRGGVRKNVKGAKESSPRAYQANNHAESTEKDWNVSSAHESKTVDSISLSSADYKANEVTFDVDFDVVFTYWMDPEEFYVQLTAQRDEYEAMMREIQEEYVGKRPIGSTRYENGWCVIARHSRDEVLYRAKVYDYNRKLNKYKVLFVDRGNRGVVTPDLMWPIMERFMKLPSMAIRCSLANNVPLNFEQQDISPQISNYVNDTMKITCKFNELVNGVHLVSVNAKRGDLLNALVADGLVKMPKDEEETTMLFDNVKVNAKLLIGQTIRVKIMNVESLEKFQVSFEHSNTVLSATYYDMNYAKVLVDNALEQLKRLDGSFCKIHVMDVGTNDILQLKILSRSFLEEPPLICPTAVFENTFTVMVAFVESLNVIHVQKSQFANLLTQLINEMYSHYESDVSSSHYSFDVAPKKMYAVKSGDSNWYRGEVLKISGDDVTVKYIDYGNTEVVKMNNLRNLTGYFSQDSGYATRIFLPLVPMEGSSPEVADNELGRMIVNVMPTITILRKYRGECIADLQVNGCSVAQELEKKGMAKMMDTDEFCREMDKRSDIQMLDTSKDSISAFVTHIVNPKSFFLQNAADVEEIEKLQESMQIVGESLPPLEDTEVGKLCLGKYSMDDLWYRAKILDSTDDMTTVQYIDYGNMDVITDKSSLKEISDAFATIKPYAVHCALPLIPKEHQDDWSQVAIDVMQNLFMDHPVKYAKISEEIGLAYVHLFSKGGSSAEEMLLRKNLAEPMSIIEANSEGFVCHFNTLTDFYMQLMQDTADLEFISESLDEVGKKGETLTTSLEEGRMYAALYPGDNCWYRAKLLHSTAGELEVIFVDFGNTAITSCVKNLPQHIAELPILSRKCSLAAPKSGQWSKEAQKKFVDIAKDGETLFEIVPVAPGETTSVRLFLDKKNIEEMLIEEDKEAIPFVNATVSHINSPGDFYLHLTAESATLDRVLNHLEEPQCVPVASREVNNICAATFSTDKCVYRARIEAPEEDDKYKVFFIDYGNTTVTSDIWELSQEMKDIEPLALRCSLVKEFSGDWSEEQREKFVEFAKGGEQIFQVEFLDKSSSPAIVRLLINDEEMFLGVAPGVNVTENESEAQDMTSESRLIVEELVENGMDRREMQQLTEEIVTMSIARGDAQVITEEIAELSISQCEEQKSEENFQVSEAKEANDSGTSTQTSSDANVILE
ncbi:maternal protein tudor isoform X2 [Phlebotomus argentipes]|uniref:maternal protein tudor isoform X2 n=1 Tax=Phlebotomus argentipes TaxID=94469 RepID=UPI0028935478|nr:maternal protein tudor isoform X2 [Phlebotomus argentipes]